MKNILAGISNWKFIVPIFLLFVFFSAYVFPDYQSRLTEAAGEAVNPLDTRFAYTQEDVLTDFEKLGQEGRLLYKVIVGRIDMIYPSIFGLLFLLILAYLLRKITHPQSNWMFLALFPLLATLFDYLENFNTLHLLKTFPYITEEAVSRGEQFTILKHTLGLVSVGLIFVLAVVLVVKKLIRNKRSANPAG